MLFNSRAKKQKDFYEHAKNCLESIELLRSQRNLVGAHYNEWAMSLTTEEAKEFAQSVIDLRKSVYCDACNQFIMKIPQIEGVWACKRECMKYKEK